jgi:hypothetical protein
MAWVCALVRLCAARACTHPALPSQLLVPGNEMELAWLRCANARHRTVPTQDVGERVSLEPIDDDYELGLCGAYGGHATRQLSRWSTGSISRYLGRDAAGP